MRIHAAARLEKSGKNMASTQHTARKTALVTGASVGIGYAAAVALAREGYAVGIAARSLERLEPLAAELQSLGATVVPVALDLQSMSSIEKSAVAVIEALGGVDVLVNNAGMTLRRAAVDVTSAEWDDVMDANLKGTFFLTQQIARDLIRAGKPGCVINMASTHGLLGFPERLVYGVSKAAIMHMTRMLAIEWARHNIRVNAIAPGTVETASRADFFSANPGSRKMMTQRVPLGRFASVEDVAGAVCYLASPHGGYITGQTLVLDGGLTVY
jgi:NAD(P)-dependent dehydrogenase (short-subunit alcohol dehydrogenase family)